MVNKIKMQRFAFPPQIRPAWKRQKSKNMVACEASLFRTAKFGKKIQLSQKINHYHTSETAESWETPQLAHDSFFGATNYFFCPRISRIFVQASAEPNLFEFCRAQPKMSRNLHESLHRIEWRPVRSHEFSLIQSDCKKYIAFVWLVRPYRSPLYRIVMNSCRFVWFVGKKTCGQIIIRGKNTSWAKKICS